MNASTVRKLSIFVLMVPAMTTLMIGTATTFAASNTHHYIPQVGNDDSWTSSFTHSPYSTGTVGSDDLGSLGYSQYGSGNHHNSSTGMIADINGDNSNSTAGSLEPGSFSSIEYAWNHPHHHHHQNNMIVDIN